MPRTVIIAVPENCLDDFNTYGVAVDYDQRIGRLLYEGGTMVSIGGETIQFPRAWIKHHIKDQPDKDNGNPA